MTQHILKIKKVKRQETDGKPDTYSVNAECETATGLSISLTVASADLGELKQVISTAPGAQVILKIEPVRYGDITQYGQAGRVSMEHFPNLDTTEEPEAMQQDPYREDLQARRDAWQGQDRAEKEALKDIRQAVKEAHQ